MANPKFLRIHDHEITGYLTPGGDVNAALRKVAVSARRAAVRFAPVGDTGRLSNNIYAGNPVLNGPWTGSVTVSSNVKYALYVHEGTPPWIYPKNGKVLAFKSNIPNRKGQFMIFADRVRGQSSNPYLAKGLAEAMAQFRAGR